MTFDPYRAALTWVNSAAAITANRIRTISRNRRLDRWRVIGSTAGERSAWHRVSSAELWLWQGGGPVLLTVGGVGDQPVREFSCELTVGGQYLVRADEWQTAEPGTDRAVLVACVVSPGFVFDDFMLAEPVGPAS